MKTLLSVSLLLLTSFSIHAQAVSDRDREALTGPVSSVQWYKGYFTYDSGKLVEGPKSYLHSDNFDKDGNRPEKRSRYPYFYFCYNSVEIETTYDARAYRTDTLSFTARRGGTPKGKEINVYDDKDRLIDSVGVLEDGRAAYRMIYKRDEKGHPVEIEYYKFGRLSQKRTFTYEYDSWGNWIKQIETVWSYKSDTPEIEPVMVFYRTIKYN